MTQVRCNALTVYGAQMFRASVPRKVPWRLFLSTFRHKRMMCGCKTLRRGKLGDGQCSPAHAHKVNVGGHLARASYAPKKKITVCTVPLVRLSSKASWSFHRQ